MQAHPTASSWNGVRHVHGARRGHVESYFLKLNDPSGRRALWLKATILERDRRRGGGAFAESWAIAFDESGRHVAAKERIAAHRASFARDRLAVRAAGLTIEEGRVHGVVSGSELTGARSRVEVDLRFHGDATPLVPFPSLRMYEGPLPSSKLVSPHPDARFTGHYVVDGERIEVDGWRGMEGHNWGTRHAELYAWCHCNAWEGDEELVLEGLTARVKLGPVLAPPLTVVCVRHRGVRYDFHAPLVIARARGEIGARRWRFHAESELGRVSGEMWAETSDFVGLVYENPDGATTYCLNSKLARGRIRLEVHGRAPLEAVTRAAALELGTKDPGHGVTMVA